MSRSRSPAAIGLRRGAVAVRDYDPRWPAEYEREAALLMAVLDGVVAELEHVGSTSVPGLAAKPVIDIAVAFTDRAKLEEGRRRLVAAGYDDRGDFGDRGGVIVAKGPMSNRTHVLHLVEATDDQWWRYLVFRDALRADEALRERYATLKKRLADEYWRDRQTYLDGKQPFIDQVVAERRRL